MCQDLLGVTPAMFEDESLIIEKSTNLEIGLKILDRSKAKLFGQEFSKDTLCEFNETVDDWGDEVDHSRAKIQVTKILYSISDTSISL